MKPRRFILISVALLLLAGLIFFFTNLTEPTYEGRTLTSWLRQFDAQPPQLQVEDAHDSQPTGATHARHAIEAIGTNGIPTLLNLLNAKDKPVLQQTEKIINRIGFPNFRFTRATQKHRWAQWGFVILGSQAQSAAPHLMQIVRTSTDQKTIFEALSCLESMKLENQVIVPCLTECLGSTNKSIAIYAATRLVWRYPDEAEKAGVYTLFPKLRPRSTNAPAVNK